MPRTAKKKKHGRFTKYSPEVADDFCRIVSTTTLPISKICKSDKRFPSPANIYMWIIRYPSFRDAYARARESRCELMADQILEIADTTQPGRIKTVKQTDKGTFTEVRTDDMIRHRELQVDARKWLLAKLRPGQYGDKLGISADVTFNVPQLARPATTGALKPGMPQHVIEAAITKSLTTTQPAPGPSRQSPNDAPEKQPASIDVWTGPNGNQLERRFADGRPPIIVEEKES
jgi:hypothetical protein